MGQAAGWVLTVVGVGIAAWLVKQTVRRARELNRRIEEYRREQDELAESGRQVDPWAALGEMSGERDRKEGRRRRA